MKKRDKHAERVIDRAADRIILVMESVLEKAPIEHHEAILGQVADHLLARIYAEKKASRPLTPEEAALKQKDIQEFREDIEDPEGRWRRREERKKAEAARNLESLKYPHRPI